MRKNEPSLKNFNFINLNLKADIRFSYWEVLNMFATTWICENTIQFMTSKCGSDIRSENLALEWKCAINVKYMPSFEDLV